MFTNENQIYYFTAKMEFLYKFFVTVMQWGPVTFGSFGGDNSCQVGGQIETQLASQ